MKVDMPDRRPHLSIDMDFQGQTYKVGFGFRGEWVMEVFVDGPKGGSTMECLLDDACILLSKLLQRGESISFVRQSVAPDCAGSVIGAIITEAEKIQGSVLKGDLSCV